jgi:hypothetical protein
MATLVSPGVAVTVIDESFYGGAGPGTVPLLVVASQQDRAHVSGTGTAPGTAKALAGQPQLMTSQFELAQTFGNPYFEKEGVNSVHGSELNEYGLLAAYSYLGAANRAFVVRADINTAELSATATEPKGDPVNGTYWFDTASTVYGIFEHDGNGFVEQNVSVYTVAPGPADGQNGDYAIDVSTTANQFKLKIAGAWVDVDTASIQAATGGSEVVTVSEHYNLPPTPNQGDVWFKITTPNFGFNPSVKVFSSVLGQFQQTVPTVDFVANAPNNPQLGDIWVQIPNSGDDAQFSIFRHDGSTFQLLSYQAQGTAPQGATPNGTYWYDQTHYYDVYVKGNNQWETLASNSNVLEVSSDEPSTRTGGAALQAGDIWVDTNSDLFEIHRWNGASWDKRDTADQTTPNGVEFGDLHPATAFGTGLTVNTGVTLSNSPDPLVYPDGMLLVNTAASGNNVKLYDSAQGAWITGAPNRADGSGNFGYRSQRAVIVQAMQAALAGNTKLREETITVTLLAAPGYPELIDELTTLNVDRKETAFIIGDAPFRQTPNGVVDWMNATPIENGEDGLNTKNNNIAVYYPSAVTTNVDGQTVLAPASHIALRTYAYNDQVSFPWFAPAGLTRGVVNNGTGVGYLNNEGEIVSVALSNGQRDSLYVNKVNPIANFPTDGLIVFGQKTLNPAQSALDRVNVSRLICYLRERFDVLARPFIFEPNDEFTRANAKRAFERFLGDILAKRGVYDFAVVCDETNNTPARIDRNEFYVDVAIEPTKAAEFIYIPIRVLNTGAISASN